MPFGNAPSTRTPLAPAGTAPVNAARATTLAGVEGIRQGDNLELLRELPDGIVQMAYADPPFNTGKAQTRHTLATIAAEAGAGDRTGFGGRRYATTTLATSSYADAFDSELAHTAPPPAVRAAILAGDGEALRRNYLVVEYLPLPDAKGPDDFRPTYRWASFPEPAPELGAGGRKFSALQLVAKVRERRELFDAYGEAAVEAAPALGRPIV